MLLGDASPSRVVTLGRPGDTTGMFSLITGATVGNENAFGLFSIWVGAAVGEVEGSDDISAKSIFGEVVKEYDAFAVKTK